MLFWYVFDVSHTNDVLSVRSWELLTPRCNHLHYVQRGLHVGPRSLGLYSLSNRLLQCFSWGIVLPMRGGKLHIVFRRVGMHLVPKRAVFNSWSVIVYFVLRLTCRAIVVSVPVVVIRHKHRPDVFLWRQHLPRRISNDMFKVYSDDKPDDSSDYLYNLHFTVLSTYTRTPDFFTQSREPNTDPNTDYCNDPIFADGGLTYIAYQHHSNPCPCPQYYPCTAQYCLCTAQPCPYCTSNASQPRPCVC